MLRYDLQFFAENDSGDRTEPATAKKLKDARDEGKVAKSKELTAGFSLLIFFLSLKIFLGFMGNQFKESFAWIYGIIPDVVKMSGRGLTVTTITTIMNEALLKVLFILLPFLAIGFIVGFAGDLVQVGWKITAKPLEPKLSKFNPINGFKRIFSKQSVFNLIKSLIKIALICYIAYTSIRDQANSLFILYEIGLNQALSLIWDIIISTAIKISVIYVVIGLADYAFERFRFNKDMRMTKQEVKDEYKNTEGDPEIKARQRQRMREASMRRMMNDIPSADVVITNPTHLAVAIKYDRDEGIAPVVVAKGEDYLAMKIREKAAEADVPIMENKPLARALYATVDIGQQIPPELYQAVAEILAVVYTNKAG
ncbi:MAG: flagellar biosynthesis protein FlhB [Pseudobutyrivibrio sp.]|nr:flagellar biosynthesis protein FlhB [Pseudobutyrivibrio sp.]